MQTKKYVEGGGIFSNPMPNAANRPQQLPQQNINLPQGQGQTQQGQGQPQQSYPFATYTSGLPPAQPTINVGGPSSQAAPQASGPQYRKGGAVKAYAKGGVVSASRRGDGIAQRGKTKGRMV